VLGGGALTCEIASHVKCKAPCLGSLLVRPELLHRRVEAQAGTDYGHRVSEVDLEPSIITGQTENLNLIPRYQADLLAHSSPSNPYAAFVVF
jgi:hypothetical protein